MTRNQEAKSEADSKNMTKKLTALGLMSGTSLDGIDIAVLHTDGAQHIQPAADGFFAYDDALRQELRALLTWMAELPTAVLADMALWPDRLVAADAQVTQVHIEAVTQFLNRHNNLSIDIIGFHGQTVAHRPAEAFTLQIGDGQAMAAALGINVVARFRQADMAAGGQGAPLAPLYHAALLEGEAARQDAEAVINLGGIANITWCRADDILAFDCGPANALIDDWVMRHSGAAFDKDGALAAQGEVNETALAALLAHPYFAAPPPKSLDRLDFDALSVDALSVDALSAADGAATLTAFTAMGIAKALDLCPKKPQRLILCGGGRHNSTLRRMMAAYCGVDIVDCDSLGWRGDALEAQLFGWLAVRSFYGLPLSRPETTGVTQPTSGGVLYRT